MLDSWNYSNQNIHNSSFYTLNDCRISMSWTHCLSIELFYPMERIHSSIRESLMLKNYITDSFSFPLLLQIFKHRKWSRTISARIYKQPTTERRMYSSQDRLQVKKIIDQQCLLLRSYLIKGSDQWERRGCRRSPNHYMLVGEVVLDVLLSF